MPKTSVLKIIEVFFGFLTKEEIEHLNENEHPDFKARVVSMCEHMKPIHSIALSTEMSKSWVDSMRLITKEKGIGSIKEDVLTFLRLRLFEEKIN